MSKLARIQDMIKQGRGLNDSASSYLLWYNKSLAEENEARIDAGTGKDTLLLTNFANNIGNWRKDVDEGCRTHEEYEGWIRIARLNKVAVVIEPKAKPSSDE